MKPEEVPKPNYEVFDTGLLHQVYTKEIKVGKVEHTDELSQHQCFTI